MLLSAGGFTRYRTETHVFNTLAPRFRGLQRPADVAAALEAWLASDCHTLSGLDAEALRRDIPGRVRGPGAFLSAIMDAMTRQQGAVRWAETTPAHILHVDEIRAQIPGALIVHVVRDGRDVAASMERQGWIRPIAIDRERPVLAAAAYWDFVVRRGIAAGARHGRAAYTEVRYEDLIDQPETTLAALGGFLEHQLDWAEIQRAGIGSVGRPNTSFPGAPGGFKGRWKTQLTEADAHDVDAMLAPTLRRLGYDTREDRVPPALTARRLAYATRFRLRERLKRIGPLASRHVDMAHFAPGSMRITADKLEGVRPVVADLPLHDG